MGTPVGSLVAEKKVGITKLNICSPRREGVFVALGNFSFALFSSLESLLGLM